MQIHIGHVAAAVFDSQCNHDGKPVTLQDVCYLTVFDHILKNCILGKTHMPPPTDLMGFVNFKNRWDATIARAADDSAEARAHEDQQAVYEHVTENSAPSAHPIHSLEWWTAFAKEIVRKYVRLLPEALTQAGAAAQMMAETRQYKGTEGKHCVLIMYDIELQAESLYHPSIRKPPFNEEAFKTMMQGVMQGRGGHDNVKGKFTRPVPGDVIMLTNGGRGTIFTAPFLDAPGKSSAAVSTVHTKKVSVLLSEESVRARATIAQGDIKQVQTMFFVTSRSLKDVVPERRHPHFDGTNRGDAIGFVNRMPGSWNSDFKQKRAIYGYRLVACGAVDQEHSINRPDNGMEPVFFTCWPAYFYENMFQVMSAHAVVDCTAGPGEAAKAALTLRLPYIGICLTEMHVETLTQHLVEWLLQAFKTVGHRLYNRKFVAAFTTKAAAAADIGVPDDSTALKRRRYSPPDVRL